MSDTISAAAFVEQAKAIKALSVVYNNGSSGQWSAEQNAYLCDCRGYVIWCIRRAGKEFSSPGTNYMIRNQMRLVAKVGTE